MTSSEHDPTDTPAPGDGVDAHTGSAHTGSARIARTVLRRAAFWIAVVLPFVALAVLVTGLGTPQEGRVLAVLLAANVVALYVGHPHAGVDR